MPNDRRSAGVRKYLSPKIFSILRDVKLFFTSDPGVTSPFFLMLRTKMLYSLLQCYSLRMKKICTMTFHEHITLVFPKDIYPGYERIFCFPI